MKGPVTGASCGLFDVDGNGTKGEEIAQAQSNEGLVEFGDVTAFSGVALVECDGGTYVDEATGNTLSAPMIRAVVDVTGNARFSVTPLTEMAVQRAMTAGDLASAIATHNQNVADAFGLDFDLTLTTPIDASTAGTDVDPAGRYGIALALISQLHADENRPLPALLADLAEGIGTQGFAANILQSLANAELGLRQSGFAENMNTQLLEVLRTGSGFSRKTENNTVEVDGNECVVTEASATKIKC